MKCTVEATGITRNDANRNRAHRLFNKFVYQRPNRNHI